MKRAVPAHVLHTMAEENARWPMALREWPREEWPGQVHDRDARPPTRVWRSRGFLVMQFETPGCPVRLTIQRTTLRADGEWMDEITWDELMRVKREAGYGGRFAVEAYPEDDQVVNVANLRHLWLVERPAWAWHAKGRD